MIHFKIQRDIQWVEQFSIRSVSVQDVKTRMKVVGCVVQSEAGAELSTLLDQYADGSVPLGMAVEKILK